MASAFGAPGAVIAGGLIGSLAVGLTAKKIIALKVSEI